MSTNPSQRARWLAVAACALLTASAASVRAEDHEGAVIQYASLPSGRSATDPAATGSLPDAGGPAGTLSTFYASVEQGRITLRASAPTQCLPGNLRDVLADVAARFGTVSVESTHRTRGHNGRAGGAPHSLHLACRAVDIRLHARARGVIAYLRARTEVGGLKVYRNGIIHIDNGERRTW